MDRQGNAQVIRALVPLANMFGFASELRNMTQGRGNFSMQFEHYEAVPYSIAEDIIEKKRESRKKK